MNMNSNSNSNSNINKVKISLTPFERFLVWQAIFPKMQKASPFEIAHCAMVSLSLSLGKIRSLIELVAESNKKLVSEARNIEAEIAKRENRSISEQVDIFRLTGKELLNVGQEIYSKNEGSSDYELEPDLVEFVATALSSIDWQTSDPEMIYGLMKKFNVDFTLRRNLAE